MITFSNGSTPPENEKTADGIPAWVLKAAEESGFTAVGTFNTAAVTVRSEVRDACAQDKCRSYGKNWSCPPWCGALEECEKKIRGFSAGLILQTTGALEDSFDYDAMSALAVLHAEHLFTMQEKLFTLARQPFLLLGSGACSRCPRCSCPGSPCPHPEKMIISLEAMGIIVSDLCRAAGVPYYHGPNTLTYSGCVMI